MAAILFFIFGALGIIAGIILSALAGLAASFTNVPFIGPLAGLTAAGILLTGLIILVFGILNLIAGNWLWDGLQRGGSLGIALSIIGILASIPFSFILGPIVILHIIFGIVLIVLIAVGWSSLR